MQISINTQVQVDSRLKTSHVGFDRRFIAFGHQPKFSTLHIVCSIELSCFFFPSPVLSFLFFFFSKPTKQIFSKRSRWQLVKISNHRLAKPIMHALSSVNRFISVTVRLITTLSDSTIFPHLQAFDFSNKR